MGRDLRPSGPGAYPLGAGAGKGGARRGGSAYNRGGRAPCGPAPEEEPVRHRAVVVAALVCLGLAACVRYPGGIAPSNIPLEPDGYTVIGPVEAQDCKVNLFGLIPVSGGNQVADGVKNALARSPGADALVNVTVDRVTKFFILWNQTCTEVRATAVRLK